MTASIPAPSAPENGSLWRDLIRLSELFQSIVALDDPKNQTALNRITVNQARIFSYLFRCRARNLPVHVKSIARDLNVSAAAASQAVDRLVSYGLIDRTPDPHDRRAVRLALSKKGEFLVQRHEQRSVALLADLLSGVPPADFAAFTRTLASLSGALQARWQAYIDAKSPAHTPFPQPETPPLTSTTRSEQP